MKRSLLLLLLSVLTILGQAQVTALFDEGFESGIPSTWSQQAMSAAQAQWTSESGELTYPSGAYGGSARAVLRNELGTTQNYVVRLITPEIDLATAYEPKLIFAHAQANRLDAFDTLKVYYRSSSSDTWHLLHTYDAVISDWQVDTLPIVATSATYQLAFEANENLGRGVVLDDVKIVSSSQCTGVTGMFFVPGAHSAEINILSFDNTFDVVVSATPVTDWSSYQLTSAVWHAENISDLTATVTGLQPSTLYYVYARSACSDYVSGYTDWVGASFTTLAAIPFSEDFSNDRPSNWFYRQGSLDAAYANSASLEDIMPTIGWVVLQNYAYIYGAPTHSFDPYWLMTPLIDLTSVSSDSAVDLRFDMALSNGMTAVTKVSTTGQSELDILVSTDAGETWTAANTFVWSDAADAYHALAPYNGVTGKVRLDLTPYIGHVIQLALVCRSYASTGNKYFIVDNLSVDYCDGNCMGVNNISVVPGVNTATVSWESAGTNSVLVEVSPNADYTDAVSYTVASGIDSLVLQSLTSATTYYIRIKQDCADNDWEVYSFATYAGMPYAYNPTSTTDWQSWTRYGGKTAEDVFGGVELGSAGTSGWTIQAIGESYGMKHAYNLYAALSMMNKLWIVSPTIQLDFEQGEYARLTCNVAASKAAANTAAPDFKDADDRFMVLISEDEGQTWTRNNARIWSNDETATDSLRSLTPVAQKVTVDLTPFRGKNIKVAFYSGSTKVGATNYIHVGDIKVAKYDPQCGGIANLQTAADEASVCVTWDVIGSNTHTEAQISSSPQYADTIQTISGTNDSIVFGGLDASTTYYIRVRQTCEEDEWAYATVTTLCPPIELPYTNTFEDETPNNLPSCWNVWKESGAYPYVVANTTGASYAHSGVNCLSWGTGAQDANSAYASIASLPAVNQAVNTLELNFYVAKTTSLYTNQDSLYVGVMTRPSDASTFVPVAGILPTSDYERYYISFTNYAGQGRYIAFARKLVGQTVTGSQVMYTPFHIDDVQLQTAPTCGGLGQVVLSNPTSNGITLSYASVGAEAYQLLVTSSPVNPDSLLTEAVQAVVVYNDTTASLNPIIDDSRIMPATTYYIYVRAVCGEGGYGRWTKQQTFRTTCTATPEEFGTETFDEIEDMDCWITGFLLAPDGCKEEQSIADRVVGDVNTYGNYLELSKKAVNTPTAVYRDGAYAITPELNVDSISSYQVIFRAATFNNTDNANNRRLYVGVVYDPTDLSAIEIVRTLSLNYAATKADAYEYTVSLSDYQGDYNGNYGKYIVFMSNAGADSTSYILIDDVRVERVVTCELPLDIQVTDISYSSASLSWENTGADAYDVLLAFANTLQPDTLSAAQQMANIQVNTNSCTLDNLQSNTIYYAYVRSRCANLMTQWSMPVEIITSVGVPYLETFDAMATGCPQIIWKGYRGVTVTDSVNIANKTVNSTAMGWNVQPISSSISGMEGNGIRSQIMLPAYNALLVSPTIDFDSIEEGMGYRLTFKLSAVPSSATSTSLTASTDHYFKVLVSTDGKSFHKLVSWQSGIGDYDYNDLQSQATTARIDLTPYAGQTIYLGFASGTDKTGPPSTHIFMDSISIDTYYTSQCGGISDLTVNLEGFDLNANWTVGGEPQISIAQLSRTADFSTLLYNDTLTANTLTITDLLGNTAYYFRIKQAECEDAEWVVKEFVTPNGLPYCQSFNVSAIPSDWQTMKGDPIAVFKGTQLTSQAGGWKVNTTNNGLPANHISYNMMTAFANRWLVSPSINLTSAQPGDSIVLLFDAAYTAANKGTAPTTGANHGLLIAVSTDDGQSWSRTDTWEWTQSDTVGATLYPMSEISETGTNLTLDFSRFAGQTIRFAFVGIVRTKTNDIHIANIKLKKVIPGCDDPSNLTVDSVEADKVTISWQGDSSKQTVIEWAEDNAFTQGYQTATVASGLTYTITGLKMATPYFVRLYQLCSGTVTCDANTTFRTSCGRISELPWTDGFETYTCNITVANAKTSDESNLVCWETINANEGVPPYIFVNKYADYVHSGKLSLFLNADANTYGYAVLPEMTIPANTLQIEFAHKESSTNANVTLEVGYITDPTDETGFVAMQRIPRNTGWTIEKIELSAIPDSVVSIARIAFKYGGGSMEYAGIDDITFSLLPECRDIRYLAAKDISTSAATVTFSSSHTGDYQFVLATAAINPDSIEEYSGDIVRNFTVSEDSVSLTGLQHTTDYYVYVRSDCGDNKGAWNSISFSTKCLGMIPYVENFDDPSDRRVLEGSHSMPACWSQHSSSTVYCGYIRDEQLEQNDLNVFNFALSGVGALYMSSNSSNPVYMALPEMQVPLDSLQVRFKMRAIYGQLNTNLGLVVNNSQTSSYARSLNIGTMDDPDDPSTFRLIKTITLPVLATADYPRDIENMDDLWQEYYVNLYGVEGKYIAFASDFSQNNNIFIDDVNVVYAPDCIEPTHLDATCTNTKADITWIGNAARYEIVCNLAGYMLDNIDPNALFYSDSNSLHVEGLLSDMIYTVYVRSLCANGETSAWSEPMSFHTACTAPYQNDFDSYTIGTAPSAGWSVYSSSNMLVDNVVSLDSYTALTNPGTYWSYAAPDSMINIMSGTTVRARLADYYTNSILTTPFIVIPELEDGLGMTLSFNAQICSDQGGPVQGDANTHSFHVLVSEDGGHNYNVLRSWLSTEGADYNYQNFADGMKVELDITQYSGKNISIGFYVQSGSSYYPYTYFFLDSVDIEYNDAACIEVKGLEVSDIFTTSANIAWLNNPVHRGQFIVELATDSFFVDPVLSDTVNEARYSFNNLVPGTDYYVRVQKDCGSEWTVACFSTLCLVTVPVNYDFEDGDVYPIKYSRFMPSCWILGDHYSVGTFCGVSLINGADYAASGNSALFFNTIASKPEGDTTWAVMPALDVNTMDSVRLRFKMRPGQRDNHGNMVGYTGSNYLHSITVGTMSDPYDISTFTPVSVCVSTPVPTDALESDDPEKFWETFVVDFQPTADRYICFLSGSDVYNNIEYIDDVSLSIFDEGCQGVDNMTVDQITLTQAALSFTYVDKGIRNARVALSTDKVLNEANIIRMDTLINDSVLVFTNLLPGTLYYAYIQQLCENTEDPVWESVSFRTLYGTRFQPDFDTYAAEDWSRFSGSYPGSQYQPASGGWNVAHADNYFSESYLRASMWTGNNFWIATPSLDLTPNSGEALVLQFDLLKYGAFQYYGADDRFMVLASSDNGSTWNVLKEWNNNTVNAGDYVYDSLRYDSIYHYSIVMSEYAGYPNVKIAFYQEASNTLEANHTLSIAHVVLDGADLAAAEATLCYGDNYYGYLSTPADPFVISYGMYTVGDNSYQIFRPADDQSVRDSLFTLLLHVDTVKTYSYSAMICEHENYLDENFSLTDVQIGVTPAEQQRILTSVSGCDSLVVMHLTIHPVAEVDTFMTVCGSSLPVVWHGYSLYNNGIYTDTLQSVWGCDSIVSLYLDVISQDTIDVDMILCYNDTLLLNDVEITGSGIYTFSYTSSLGCDSVVNYHVTELPQLGSSYTVSICEGESYTDDHFIGISTSGRYEVVTSSVDGCDSTLVLYLTVIDASEPDIYMTYDVADLPLVIDGVEVLPVGTECGEYTYTVTTECGDVTYHITLVNGSGLNDLFGEKIPAMKVVYDGQVYIIRNDEWYDIYGRRVNAPVQLQ